MSPDQALWQLLGCLALGAGAGVWYVFLSPVKNRLLRDCLFLPGAVGIWLRAGFGLCRGQLRMVHFFCLILGAVAFAAGPGRFLRGIFRGFWALMALPGKIFEKFAKFLFATGKKWVTIECNRVSFSPDPPEVAQMEKKKHPKIVFCPSPRLLKILVAVLVVLSLGALSAVHLVRGQLRRQTWQKQQEALALEQENQALESRAADPDSIDYIRDIAQEELDLVDPEAVFIGRD